MKKNKEWVLETKFQIYYFFTGWIIKKSRVNGSIQFNLFSNQIVIILSLFLDWI